MGVEWVTLAAIAEKFNLVAEVPSFTDPFRAHILVPALSWIAGLRGAADDSTLTSTLKAFQTWVIKLQVPHFGPKHTDEALKVAGAEAVAETGKDAGWVAAARAAVAHAAWWSCPRAAVSSQGVVAWLAADLDIAGGARVLDHGCIHYADDSAEHSILVERMLQPIFLKVPRNGHAERRALVCLLRSIARAFGYDDTDQWEQTLGSVQLYASHYLCISCLAAVAQFTRRLPRVQLQVAFDDAWEVWEERPFPLAAASVSGAFGRTEPKPDVLIVGRAA